MLTSAGDNQPDSNISMHDEVSNFVKARYVSASEAMWEFLESKMHDRSHTIVRLAVHLPNEKHVYYIEGEELQALDKASSTKTTLEAWFELNKADSIATHL